MIKLADYMEPEVVIWIQTAFLGDIILSTGAMVSLKKSRPQVKQVLITTEIGKKALSGSNFLDEILVLDKKNGLKEVFMLAKKIRALKFDQSKTVILQPHKSYRSSLLAILLKFKRVTYFESAMSIFSNEKVERVALVHECERIKLLLQPLGISRFEALKIRPSISTPNLSGEFDFFQKKTIAIAPGSVWNTKKWVLDGFLEVVIHLIEKTNFNVLLLGSPTETKETSYIVKNIDPKGNDRIMDLAGRTSLEQLPSIYKNLTALVCNDSSPIHYASAFNVPTIAIFGATKPAMGFGPLAKYSKVVELDELDCRPCSDHGPMICPLEHFKCMRELPSERVIRALSNVCRQIDEATGI